MSASPYSPCRRNACANMVETAIGKKYCSDKCRRSAASNRRKNRRDIPVPEAIADSANYSMGKLKRSAIYLAESYKLDRVEVLEMLVNEMEELFDDFWDKEDAA